MFKQNVGTIDRGFRTVLGLTLVALAVTKGMTWAWVGVVPLATAAAGWCPLYALLGINTCGVKKA